MACTAHLLLAALVACALHGNVAPRRRWAGALGVAVRKVVVLAGRRALEAALLRGRAGRKAWRGQPVPMPIPMPIPIPIPGCRGRELVRHGHHGERGAATCSSCRLVARGSTDIAVRGCAQACACVDVGLRGPSLGICACVLAGRLVGLAQLAIRQSCASRLPVGYRYHACS